MTAYNLSRRELLYRLALFAASARAAKAAGFQSPTVHHISLEVGDLARSSEFYHRVFGCAVQNRNDGTVLLSLEKGHIILRLARLLGKVDHFAIGIDSFNKESVMRELNSRGAKTYEDDVAGLNVKDPDGFPVQLTSNATYVGTPAAFAGSRLDHVSIYAGDVRRSAEFYQRAFGFSVLNQEGTTIRLAVGTSHISLRKGDPSGRVDHFAIGIDHFEEASVIRELRSRGAEAVKQGEAGLHIKDPDAYSVQVTTNNPA